MIDINLLREQPEVIKKALGKRNLSLNFERLIDLDTKKREKIQKVDSLRAKKNEISSAGKPEDIQKAKEIKSLLKQEEEELKNIEEEFNKLFLLIPNIPLDDVPVGLDDKANGIVKKEGKPKSFAFKVKDHLELAKLHNLIDIERATKVSGSRFGILKNEAALLEIALVNFCLDNLVEQGFTFVIPPTLLREEMMRKMGYVDTKEDLAERYFFDKDNLFLAGTAEQMVGPMHAGEVFKKEDLPKRYLAFSSCFREEAGSYGKDTRGIFRVHQFDKLEMFSFTEAEDSKEEHQFLIKMQEKLMKKLDLPYQLVHLSTGDMSRPSASTYDIETWIPSQNKYRETHSASNCTDFQSRRLNIRVKENNDLNFVHTLNATAIAVGRIIIAILENNQDKKGNIKMPKVLHKYLGFKKVG
jgi:seryl-tRNA synthetase